MHNWQNYEPLLRRIFANITSVAVEEPVVKAVQKRALQEMAKRMDPRKHVTSLAIANILEIIFVTVGSQISVLTIY